MLESMGLGLVLSSALEVFIKVLRTIYLKALPCKINVKLAYLFKFYSLFQQVFGFKKIISKNFL